MVKELTMDNSIFSLGANADSNLSANDASVANEFQAAFETAKNNYADQKEFSNDTQKVAKAAEKTLEIEKELNQKTEQTEVYKKVSTNTKTKSPQTLDIDTTSQTHTEADVNGVSDTYSFTIKQAVNGEQEAAPKAEQEVELTSENSNTIDENISNDEFVIENNTSSLESTKINAQTIAAEIVNFVAEKVTNVSTSTNDDESEESEEETSTTLLNTLTTETTENILNLTLQTTDETVEEVIVLTEETNLDIALESAVADTETVEENFTGAAADIEVEVQTENKGIELGEGWEILDTESQQPLTKEELKNLVSNNTKEVDLKTNETVLNADTKDLAPMDELNVEDVKLHTLEEIEAGKNLQKEVEIVEPNVNSEVKTEISTQISTEGDLNVQLPETETNTDTEAVQNLHSDEKVDKSAIDNEVQLIEKEAKAEEFISTDDTSLEFDTNSSNEIKSEAINIDKDIKTTEKETLLTEENITVENDDNAKNIVETEVKTPELEPVVKQEPASDTKITSNINHEQTEIEVNATVETETKVVAAEEENTYVVDKEDAKISNNTTTEDVKSTENFEKTVDKVVNDLKVDTETNKTNTETNSIEVVETKIEDNASSNEFENNNTDNNENQDFILSKDNKENQEVDLDKLINDGIKLAFVDTTSSAKETETVDIISALENKFAENIETETDVEFSMNTEIVEEDVNTSEQVSSLEEIVSVDEFEELNVQIKDSQKTTSNEKTTTSNTVNSTTEQLIRFSIEGETGYEPSAEFTTFKTEIQTPAQQSAPSSAKDVLAQLSEKLSTFNLRSGSKLTMQLSPENLGKIEIKLTNTAQGIIAEMTVSSDETCDMMKKNLDDLKDTLQKYGVRFDNVTVKTTATQQSTSQQDYTEQNNNQKHQQEQNRENEKQRDKSNSFEDMVNSFTNEEIEE